jgi:hypothetical protein
VSAHEIIHEVVKSGQKGLVLKLNYEKSYDKVDWQFLEELLQSRGFSGRWITWIMSLVKGGQLLLRLMMILALFSSWKMA